MWLEHLRLRHFRNYHEETLTFCERTNVLLAQNGQGKTNSIEAIGYLSSARSFRSVNDEFVIENQAEFASIRAEVHGAHQTNTLDVVLRKEGKYIQVNRKPCARLSEFVGVCNVIIFSPYDMNYFEGSPGKRRRQLDLELGKIDGSYLDGLSQYNKLLKERNAILKAYPLDETYLEMITEQCILTQLPLMTKRALFIETLNQKVEKIFNVFFSEFSKVKMTYVHPLGRHELGEMEALLRRKFAQNIGKDKLIKATSVGIHRDDIEYYLDDVLLQQCASQGQKRIMLLAYKLALLELIEEKTGEYPILCLDDVFSELDQQRIELLFKMIPKQVQVVISATHLPEFLEVQDVKIIHIRAGKVE